MVLSSLDGPFCNVTEVVVWPYQLVRHAQLSAFVLVGLGDFVVEDLVRGRDTLLFHFFRLRRLALIIPSSVLFFITSTHVEAPYISCMII